MHVCNRGTGMGEAAPGKYPGIAIMMYDAHGEKHGLSEDGFGWVFDIPDGTVVTQEITTLQKMNALADSFRTWQGNNDFWLSAPLIADIDDETLVRAWKWFEDCYDLNSGFDEGSLVCWSLCKTCDNLFFRLSYVY